MPQGTSNGCVLLAAQVFVAVHLFVDRCSGVITPFFVNNSDSYAPVQAPQGAMPPPSPRLRISTDYDDPKVWTGRSLSFVARCPRPLPLAIVYNPTLVSRPGLVHLRPNRFVWRHLSFTFLLPLEVSVWLPLTQGIL